MPDQPAPYPHHVQTRARERYGLFLSAADVDHLAEKCRAREGVLVSKATRDNPTITILVDFEGVVMPLVYHPANGRVVTVLPPNYRIAGGRKNYRAIKIASRKARQRKRRLSQDAANA